MPRCTHCQHDLAFSAKLCPHCGNTDPFGIEMAKEVGRLAQQVHDLPVTPKRFLSSVFIIVGGIVCYFIAINKDVPSYFVTLTSIMFALMLVITWVCPATWYYWD